MANEAHKIKLLVLWDILCKNTDENHALNTDEISELLALRGLNVSRKILVQDIATLCDNGYEVLSYKKIPLLLCGESVARNGRSGYACGCYQCVETSCCTKESTCR